MMLPSPTRYYQSFKDKKLSEFAEETIESILQKLRIARFLTKDEAEEENEKSLGFEADQKPSKAEASDSGKEEELSIEEKMRRAEDGGSAAKNKRLKRSKPRGDGTSVENEYRVDRDLEIEDNPSFDDDALIDQVDGVDAEYTLE